MRIRNFMHKGLRQLYEEDNARSVPAVTVSKLRNMLAVLDDLQSTEELRALVFWRPHQLSGDRRGTWSLFVTRNWRMTFWVDDEESSICDLNLEDYH